MSKIISQLLGKKEEQVSEIIAKLEALAGYPGEDIRLLADIRANSSRKITELGLDPADTTNRELNAALILRLKKDGALLAKAVGVSHTNTSDKLSRLLVNLAAPSVGSTWSLKKHSARDLLLQAPPKKVMKFMGYRSVHSMLKREDLTELYAAAVLLESSSWQQNFWKIHARLKSSDFEMRDIELKIMPSARWSTMTGRTGLVSCILPLGSAVVWPAPGHLLHNGLSLSVLLFEGVETLRIYGCALKLEQTKPDFGQKVLDFMRPELDSAATIAGQPLNWGALHRYYGTLNPERQPMCFDPHINSEDLHSRTISEHMANLHPTFSWWTGNNFAASWAEGYQTSMNIIDIVVGRLQGRPLTHGLNKSLWNELIGRYLRHPGVEDHLLSQLDNYTPENETVSISISNKRMSPQAMIQAEFA